MSAKKIVSCLELISDDMIEEAMVSEKKKTVMHKGWLIAAAACICAVITAGVFFMINLNRPQVADNEEFIQMSLSEIEDSIYSDYVPDLTEYGYDLDSAGVYGGKVFKATFISADSEIVIQVEPYSETTYGKHIVDMDSAGSAEEVSDPAFYAEQLSKDCMEYIPVETTLDRLLIEFSVIKDDLAAEYIIKVPSLEEGEDVFDLICRCY